MLLLRPPSHCENSKHSSRLCLSGAPTLAPTAFLIFTNSLRRPNCNNSRDKKDKPGSKKNKQQPQDILCCIVFLERASRHHKRNVPRRNQCQKISMTTFALLQSHFEKPNLHLCNVVCNASSLFMLAPLFFRTTDIVTWEPPRPLETTASTKTRVACNPSTVTEKPYSCNVV